MTFLNASLLLGALAVAVPIYLHLTGQKQPKQVVFGSLFLLQRTLQTTQSKVRLKRWWLLAVRVLLLLATALALAGPAIAAAAASGMKISLFAMLFGAIALVAATAAMVVWRKRPVAIPLAIIGLIGLIGGGLGSGFAIATGPSVQLADGPVSLAIVIDNGPTSARKIVDEDQLSRHRRDAISLVSNLPNGSEVVVLDRSGIAATQLTDPPTAVTRVQDIVTIDSAAPISEVINAAERIVTQSSAGTPQVVVLSDRSAGTWSAGNLSAGNLSPETPPIDRSALVDSAPGETGDSAIDRRGELAANAESTSTSESETRPDTEPEIAGVSIQVISRPPVKIAQWKLSAPTLTPAFPPPMTASSIAVTLASERWGEWEDAEDDPPSESVTVELQIYENDPSRPVLADGELLLPALVATDRRLVQISVGESTDIALDVPPLPAGSHHGVVRIVNADDFDRDNERFFTIHVQPTGDVLLVGDSPDESFVIEQTIAEICGPITSIATRDLPLIDLSDYQSAILLDPPRSVLASKRWIDWVQSGGKWMIALGPAADSGSVGRGEAPFFMPALNRVWRVPPPGTFLQIASPNHPITARIGDDTPWADFPVNQYWRITSESPVETTVEPTAGLSPGRTASNESSNVRQRWAMRTLIKYANTEHPALVQVNDDRQRGVGLIWTTPLPALVEPTSSWNDLFGSDPWPIWLATRACVEELVHGDRRSRNLAVGQSLVTPRQEIVDAPQATRVQWLVPSATVSIPVDIAAVDDGDRTGETTKPPEEIVFGPLQRRGTHWIRGGDSPTGFSVNIPPRQTDLRFVEVDQIKASLEKRFDGQINILSSPSELRLTGDSATRPTPITTPLLIIAAIALVAEQWIVGRR